MFNNEFKKIEKYMDLFLLHQKKNYKIFRKFTAT